jgi:hypothetical protein
MRICSFIALALLTVSCNSGQGSAKPDKIPPPQTGGQDDAIRVILPETSKTITPVIFGYNTQSIKGPGWDKTQFLDRITELDPGNFRYPGGTVGNFWDWNSGYYNEVGRQFPPIGPSAQGPMPYKLENLREVYDRTGAMPVYMLNMLTESLDDQLDMLRHARQIGLPVQYIEMGNEFYLDDHPEKYNYPTHYPRITDYTDSCRVWTSRLKQEFPDARIAMIGVNHPASWVNRQRAREWNDVAMRNMQGISCDAMTIHIYAKNNLPAPTPYDMIGQCIAFVQQQRVLDPSIPERYPLWITEYNFEGNGNPFPGQWVHGLAATLMSAQLICVPRVEMVCFFNLTAGLSASAIYDEDFTVSGEKAQKYALSATGEGLKMLSKAQKNATSVRKLDFAENPKAPTQKNGDIPTLWGYKFDGNGPRVLLVNIGQQQATVSTVDLGFTPASFEQISAPQNKAVTSSASLSRVGGDIPPSQTSIVLRANSITVIK